MAKGSDYNIKKTEKGPLQRFKNQNLILKKYGETGLKIYRAITGKRTVKELQKDLGIEKDVFDSIINYLQEAGMVELTMVGLEKKEEKPEVIEEVEEEAPEAPPEEEIAPEEVEEVEEEAPEEEVEIEKPEVEAEEEEAPEEEEEEFVEEIKPIGIEPIEEKEEEAPEEEEGAPEEEEAEEEVAEEEEEAPEEEKYEFGEIEAETPEEEGEELTPIEKIIKNKYGDIGLQVYTLIDGQKTAEEIMKETGLSESKLIEILDFMDDQGIIKLDYPKAKEKEEAEEVTPEERKEATEAFGPMLGEEAVPEMVTIPSPVEVPVRAPMDIVKSVQMKAKILLKFKEGGRVFEEIDGRKDVIDIALKLDIPLYRLYDILHFMLDNEMIIMKPETRDAVKKKYGDDGYTVYKRYGRGGLMLYELIGKDLTIKEMADKVTREKAKIVDMFLFIHEVLGIELPIDRSVLERQLGI